MSLRFPTFITVNIKQNTRKSDPDLHNLKSFALVDLCLHPNEGTFGIHLFLVLL